MHYLTGEEVSVTSLKTIAQEFGFMLWPHPDDPFLLHKTPYQTFPEMLSVLTDHITEKKLNSLFTFPVSFILDANAQSESLHNFFKYQARNQLDKTIGVLLTCPVIYACDVAQIFTEALHQRLHFPSTRYSNIHMAIHEALVNGLVHGNLKLPSSLRQSARDFVDYARIVNERLLDPAYANKSISIWATWNTSRLEIKIRDEGAGYTVLPPHKKHVAEKRSGRGLYLIAGTADSCTIDDFGREITLSFILNNLNNEQDIGVSENAALLHDPVTDFSDCRILIIEDNPSNQILVSQLLNVVGIGHIETAQDGVEGLEKAFSMKPDLVILDITMPRMNGYEVLHQLRTNQDTASIPVLIQTASDTRAARDKTFSAGATDFITKPLNPLEFFSRIRVHLENRLLVKHLETKLAQINEELELAQKMQESLLPPTEALQDISQRYHLDISYTFLPSSHLGGDFWQIFPLAKDKVAFYICDFSGHGVSAAMNTFRLHTLIGQMDMTALRKPSEFLFMLNNSLVNLLPRGQFATFFFGILNKRQGTLTYAGASSPFPILVKDNKPSFLDTSGMPLGILKDVTYKDKKVPFSKEMGILLYSDSFTEQQNKEGNRLDYDGFMKMTQTCFSEKTSQQVIAQIMQKFHEFSDTPSTDDITAVYLKGLL